MYAYIQTFFNFQFKYLNLLLINFCYLAVVKQILNLLKVSLNFYLE